MERHLRLVYTTSNATKAKENKGFSLQFIFDLGDLFISKEEKIYAIREQLLDIYRDYEITTGYVDEPYFLRTERKIKRIIREDKVDYYYKLLKKLNKK